MRLWQDYPDWTLIIRLRKSGVDVPGSRQVVTVLHVFWLGAVYAASTSMTRDYGNCLLLSQILLHLDLLDLHNMVGRCRSISPGLLRCT